MQTYTSGFQFEINGPFYIQKEKDSPSPRDEIIEDIFNEGKIPFYISNNDNCEIFYSAKNSASNDKELDMVVLVLEYPPNFYMA